MRPADFPWDRYAYAEAVTYFASGPAARGGDPARALPTSSGRAAPARKSARAEERVLVNQAMSTKRAAEGWIARAEGREDEATPEHGGDLEATTEKNPVTPGSIVPAREILGDLLLSSNQPDKALEAYERSLKDSPNRLNGLSGAARAAQLAGDRSKAHAYYVQVAKLLDATRTR